ncbi:MAG: hypothetical protein ABJ251_04965 [Paracoccaceae bacterium]
MKSRVLIFCLLVAILTSVAPSIAFENTDVEILGENLGECVLWVKRDAKKKNAFIFLENEASGVSAMHLAQHANEIVIETPQDQELVSTAETTQGITPQFLEKECGFSEVDDFLLLPHDQIAGDRARDKRFAQGLKYADQAGILLNFVATYPKAKLPHRYAYGAIGTDTTWRISEKQPLEYAGDTLEMRMMRNITHIELGRRWPSADERGLQISRQLKIIANPMRRIEYENGAIAEVEEHISNPVVGATFVIKPGTNELDENSRRAVFFYPDGLGYGGYIDGKSLKPIHWGIKFHASGRTYYRGRFKNGHFHGSGIITPENGGWCSGEFSEGALAKGTYSFWNPFRKRAFCSVKVNGELKVFQ